MAHFAKINDNNEVLTVLVVNNENILDSNGDESESIGQQYLETHNNWPANKWIQTSYNTSQNTHKSGDNSKAFRGNYAGIGFTWDSENNIFWPPKPYNSWVKNLTNAISQSPIGDVPELTEDQKSQNNAETHDWSYIWNEDTSSWNLKNSVD